MTNNDSNDIVHLRNMTQIVLMRIWKSIPRDVEIPDDDIHMVTMAIEGKNTAYIAAEMRVSTTTVQTRIKKSLDSLVRLNTLAGYLEIISHLKEKNKKLSEENFLLKQNVNELATRNKDMENCVLATPKQCKILMTTIDKTDLSARIKHVMKKANIRTVMELAKLNKNNLRSMQNLGEKSVDEIQRFLSLNELSFGMGFIVDLNNNEIHIINGKSARI